MAEPIPPNKQLSELAYRSPVITGRALTPNLEQLEDSNLAGELFGPDAIMAMAGPSSPDGWPVAPSHTCGAYGNGTVITLRETSLTAARIITPAWRSNEARQGCPACYHRRVLRYCNQIITEQESGPLWSLQLGAGEYKRQAAAWRKRNTRGDNARYCPFPQPDNQYIIIHNQEKDGGEPIPSGRAELYELVKAMSNTPENKRISPSNGWGGQWQGARGDGRVKQEKQTAKASGSGAAANDVCVQLWTKRSLKEIAARLGAELERRQHSIKVDMNPFDAYHCLADCELHERHTNRLGVTALLEMFAGVEPDADENVTPNAHSKELNTMSLKRDILAGDSGQGGEKSGAAVADTPLFPKALQHRAVSYSPGGRHASL